MRWLLAFLGLSGPCWVFAGARARREEEEIFGAGGGGRGARGRHAALRGRRALLRAAEELSIGSCICMCLCATVLSDCGRKMLNKLKLVNLNLLEVLVKIVIILAGGNGLEVEKEEVGEAQID